jgi:aflatoxin B1 aldehyde reductase
MIGQIYTKLYSHPNVHASIETVKKAAAKHNISGHAAALRWTMFHSILDGAHGDGVIFGVSKMEQLTKTMDSIDAGPLPEELAEALSKVFATLGGNGPKYHM